MRFRTLSFFCGVAATAVTTSIAWGQQPVAPAAPETTVSPTPQPSPTPQSATDIVLDAKNDSVGIAQQTARAKGLQTRILWMDAGANVGNLNSEAKVTDIIQKVKSSGINTIVLDVKPIVGETIYPSKFAPRLTKWTNGEVDPSFDVLRSVLDAAHAAGLTVYANMSTFGEGHKYVKRGLAYTHPDWQTIMYETDRSVSYEGASAPITYMNQLPKDDKGLGALTGQGLIGQNRPGYTIAILNFDARVTAVYDGASLADAHVTLPPRGSALAGSGVMGDWLKAHAIPGEIMTYRSVAKYVPIVSVPDQKITMFCNPINPEVRQHNLDIVREVATNYDVDGMIFDDRLRYAAINADFSPLSRTTFEQHVGHALTWPDDVYRESEYPGQAPIYGPYYQDWLTWRASNIQSWVAEASNVVHSVRPKAQMAVYVGSWYGDYEKVGMNWAGQDFQAGYPWLTPEYQKTGIASLLDWITTGCYYTKATVAEAVAAGTGPGATVEGAGLLSNRVVNDAAWTYAGIYALSYENDPAQFERAIKAAAGSTQGVMIFDMSQIIQYNWWDTIADAFGHTSAVAPHSVDGLLAQVRAQHAADKAAGKPQPEIPAYQGIEDTGF
ncbi:hypothetical protein CCAX7_34580 [Capsulimonas corticalis]|uniref:Uncharacterized protein n=1 Tax=Capsulimonas corticalis TaxID=2219043 RepID=A0A402CYE1_9BACT|nr:alpha amylase family protein [Capsulimonas corticalis]BDI31407.1 hypothetical protein CCAX7_34580 [Capsulimonas corticalis]